MASIPEIKKNLLNIEKEVIRMLRVEAVSKRGCKMVERERDIK